MCLTIFNWTITVFPDTPCSWAPFIVIFFTIIIFFIVFILEIDDLVVAVFSSANLTHHTQLTSRDRTVGNALTFLFLAATFLTGELGLSSNTSVAVPVQIITAVQLTPQVDPTSHNATRRILRLLFIHLQRLQYPLLIRYSLIVGKIALNFL